MPIPIVEVNYIAVLAAAVLNMAIGVAWYSPYVFGEIWMKAVGITEHDMQKNKKKMWQLYGMSFVAALIMAFVLAHIIQYVQANSIYNGIEAGAWVWLGFVATSLLPVYLFENRPIKLYMINAAYQLVALAGMGALLVLWV
jgi:hypothetical protein